MKQGWHSESIEDLCEVEYGTRVVRKRDAGTIYPVYGGGGATFSMDIYNREDRMVIARFAMSKRCTRFVDGRFFLNDSGLTISPLDGNTFDQDFLNYHILSLNDEIYSLARGTAQKNLNVDAFKKVKLSYPTSLEEQKQIVAKLDQCFEAIDKAKANAAKNLENAKELFQSKLNEIFSQKGDGWVEKKLGDVCKLIDSLHKTPSYIKEGGFPMIRVTDIKDGFINFKNARRVNKDVYGEFSKRHIASIGDLVLSRVGSYGIPAIVETDTLFCLGQNTVFLIPLINTYWIYYFLISPNSKQQMDKSASGVAQPTVSLKAIKQINIPIPSLEEQKQIVKILDSLRRQTQSLESKYQQELNSLEELKKSILQKAFEGEL
jgi:type I restriction enzyme S subunit